MRRMLCKFCNREIEEKDAEMLDDDAFAIQVAETVFELHRECVIKLLAVVDMAKKMGGL